MKKYIAGFRSNKKINKKISTAYYILTILFFLMGSSKSVNEISLCLLMLSTPSLIFNIKYLFSKNNKKQKKKIFTNTLAAYLLLLVIFSFTIPEINEITADSQLLSQETINKENSLKKDDNKDEEIQEYTTDELSENKVEIHFINTGNSDAILIKEGSKAALIDGGDNDDESTVVSYLKKQGVNELEYIFATHPDADHIGGLDAVVDSIPVKSVYVSNGESNTKTYADFITSMANKGLNPSVPLLNSEFKLGKSKFKVLSVANEKDINNNSIVLEYTNVNDKILFMGDAGREIESSINVSDVDLLKVGHHGSRTSSDSSFIKKVNPEYAVITVGANNRYGHPHKETMNILKNNNIEVHRSDECGDIIFISTGNGLEVNCKVGSYNIGNKKQSSLSSTKNNYSSVNKTSTSNSSSVNNSNLSNNNSVSNSNSAWNNSSSNNNSVGNNNSGTSNTSNVNQSNNTSGSSSSDIVYWTPNGKSYHSTKSCPTLSRSKIINSGTISQSGKYDPCDRCM